MEKRTNDVELYTYSSLTRKVYKPNISVKQKNKYPKNLKISLDIIRY